MNIETARNLNISDFTLHSIGVILLRQGEENVFLDFLNDILPEINILKLPQETYPEIVSIKKRFILDFDDSYQYCICKNMNLRFVTLDTDFKNLKSIPIEFYRVSLILIKFNHLHCL